VVIHEEADKIEPQLRQPFEIPLHKGIVLAVELLRRLNTRLCGSLEAELPATPAHPRPPPQMPPRLIHPRYPHLRAAGDLVPIQIWIERPDQSWIGKSLFAQKFQNILEIPAGLLRLAEPGLGNRRKSGQISTGHCVIRKDRLGDQEKLFGLAIQQATGSEAPLF